MRTGISRLIPRVLVACVAVALAGLAPLVQAAPVPAKIELSALRAIQLNNMNLEGDDPVYVLVSGVAQGQEVQKRIPDQGAIPTNRKKPAVTEAKPVALWEGQLGDGEFALLTVVVFQGEGKDAAKVKSFQDQLAAALKKPAARSKKTLAANDAKTLTAETVKAEQEVITKIKDTFSREKKTDHYGGLFNVLVWNNNGKLVKRIDPVGLTFGEHDGTDPKVYTKLKLTRTNVFEQDPDSKEWFETQVRPLNDDEDGVNVKMLENEYVKEASGDMNKKTTDYLATIKVYNADKALKWTIGGQHPGKSALHEWWEYAE